MLDEQPHQPLGVEDELVPAGLLVPAAQLQEGWGRFSNRGHLAPPRPPCPRAHLMMVCMPRTCGVLLRTLSVCGSGWHWCAEASAALGTQRAGLEEGLAPSPLSLHTL